MSYFDSTYVLIVKKIGFDVEHGNIFEYLEGSIDTTANVYRVIDITIEGDPQFRRIDKEQLEVTF